MTVHDDRRAERLAWSWPADVEPYRADLGAMLADSVADDGILGYAEAPSEQQRSAFADGLQQACTDGSGHVLVGRDDEGVAAMVAVRTNGMPNCRHLAEVSKAYLAPRVRGSRTVFELAREVCAKAAELGVDVLVIDVREGSKAHKVWARMGFETFGVLPDYSRVGGQSHAGHYMWHAVASLRAVVEDRLATT